MAEREQAMLSTLQFEEYEMNGEIYKDYSTADHQPLIEWVLSDTATLSYPFTFSQKHNYVKIATSIDRNLRIYTWDTGKGGTMICWGNLIQYRDGKTIKSFQRSLYGVLHPEEYVENEIDCGSSVNRIHTIYSKDGKAIYLIDKYFRASSNLAGSNIQAIRIQDGLLEEFCFETCDGFENQVSVEYTIADWYFKANLGEGWSWIFRLDTMTQDLYVPEVNDILNLTDQYTIYHFDGEYFRPKRSDGPFWIYHELRNFQELVVLFNTKHYLVRIDKISDGKYRYASWSQGTPMSEKPELILYGRKKVNNTYIFENGSYIYQIQYDNANCRLIILRHGKLLLNEIQKTQYD